MLNLIERHNTAISRCGIPLTDELLHACQSNAEPQQLEEALIWLALLHGLDELMPALATAPKPLKLTANQAVGLYAALHLAGNPAQAESPLLRLLTSSVGEDVEAASSTSWQVMNRAHELTEGSPWEELIRQASLLHLSDPAALLTDWLKQLERFIAERMPFAALLRLSILCRSPDKLPEDWQTRLAKAITTLGDLPDAIPLYRFWMVACQVVPGWDFACIRAADLALRFEDFPIADRLLERFERIKIQNAWFYDVKARCRYGYGDLSAAVRLWSLALAKVDPAAHEHQVFRDRMMLALRGKFGLAEACRLARSGQLEKALQLLRILILNDPGFPNHYNLLLSLQNKLAGIEQQSVQQGDQLARIEQVLDDFRPLWMGKEEPSLPGDDPSEANAAIVQAARFLDNLEQSLSVNFL
jgi:tetratricopeptide (TPR) repeat protein